MTVHGLLHLICGDGALLGVPGSAPPLYYSVTDPFTDNRGPEVEGRARRHKSSVWWTVGALVLDQQSPVCAVVRPAWPDPNADVAT